MRMGSTTEYEFWNMSGRSTPSPPAICARLPVSSCHARATTSWGANVHVAKTRYFGLMRGVLRRVFIDPSSPPALHRLKRTEAEGRGGAEEMIHALQVAFAPRTCDAALGAAAVCPAIRAWRSNTIGP